jgi:hypothetical protein
MKKATSISHCTVVVAVLIVIVVLPAIALLRPLTFAQVPSSPAAAGQKSAGEEEPFTGAFSNGVKIELVGLAMHPSQGQPWWTPDGMIMPKPPYAQNRVLVRAGEGQLAIEICWRWSGLPAGERPNVKWETSPASKARADILADAAGNRLNGLHAAAVVISADDDEFNVHFSLSVRAATTAATPAFESIEFRGVTMHPGNYESVRVMRISADGNEVRLPAAGVTKALVEQQRNSPEFKANEERAKKDRVLQKALGDQPAYQLKDGERFKHVPPPFSATRQEYWSTRSATPGREPDPNRPGFMLFRRADGELDWKSASFSTPTIGRILDRVFNIKSHRIEGGDSLLATELPGDWVLTWDPNWSISGDTQANFAATPEDIEAFERIVQDELIEIADFELREVKRPVYVVRGSYKYTKVPDPDGKMRERRSDFPDEIKILAGNRMSSGSFVSYLEVLELIGDFLKVPLVDETTMRPGKRQIMLNIYGPPRGQPMPSDPATIDAVLASLTTQTGYTFTKEERPVKVLFIKHGVRE